VIEPTDIELLIPSTDVADPEVSIVIPALNEALTITTFIEWCHEGLAAAGVAGEILIVDSSTDDTPDLALAAGARVLRVPKRGLGQAYRDAIPFTRGRFVIMGDADCTYDFRQLPAFVNAWRDGAEFVMGSRWRGTIEPGAMPGLHRYFGTPLTTFMLNRIYRSHYTDIHCGMRGLTMESLRRIDIQSRSWEYASEMVLKATRLGLRTVEVPVVFLRDQPGRTSHHRRLGWWSPWHAGWINMRAMFQYGADSFLVIPGLFLAVLGMLLVVVLAFGDVHVGRFHLSLNTQILGLVLLTAGWQWYLLGEIARSFLDLSGSSAPRVDRLFAYSRSVLISFAAIVIGIALAVPLVADWVGNGYSLSASSSTPNHLAVLGVSFVACGFSFFASTLVFAALQTRLRAGDE
jgi:glycosyltransferase involved in cell wall biosynthesis